MISFINRRGSGKLYDFWIADTLLTPSRRFNRSNGGASLKWLPFKMILACRVAQREWLDFTQGSHMARIPMLPGCTWPVSWPRVSVTLPFWGFLGHTDSGSGSNHPPSFLRSAATWHLFRHLRLSRYHVLLEVFPLHRPEGLSQGEWV